MSKIRTTQKSGKSHTIIILLIAAVILGCLYFKWDNLAGMMNKKAVDEEKLRLEKKIELLEKELASMGKRFGLEPTASETFHSEKKPAILPEQKTTPAEDPVESRCSQLTADISDFFRHLDEQDYVKAYELEGGSKKTFAEIIEKLIAHPPTVVRETDSLFIILNNTTHFFRILGKKNMFLLKEIMTKEPDIIEPALALFHEWSIMAGQCEENETGIRLPIETLYEYAGFFLNTLGGQSYLFRRESRIRILVKYYCVLILDRTNTGVMNKYGIDIRYPINTTIQEMEPTGKLAHKNEYLDILYKLKAEYGSQYEPEKNN
ncbi:MAG: hypothetical protein KAR13_11990 [Desulfobulbaceae bacterium]|nr:hypothetical protein [Desulfobulbaceae bacterium]MCK5437024.1 hypothetical protein [Desulfobulbaceae bacterium]MCK5545346.1 hypothetical protein [Desulfobulbaceae bacterium]